MASYSDRDTSLIPYLTFSFVEDYIKRNKVSSGDKSINKGFKYFSEGYIHELKVTPADGYSIVTGKCYRSQKKNEPAHNVKIQFGLDVQAPSVQSANCTCPIGESGACGHVTETLYQLTKYKQLGQKALPEDIAKTSLPQTWHTPRGTKISGKAVQDLQVLGYSKVEFDTSAPKVIKSTLYNPLQDDVDWSSKYDSLKEADPELLVLDAIKEPSQKATPSKYGNVPSGCILGYQQKVDDNFVMNIFDGVAYPSFPVTDVMINTFQNVLTRQQTITLEGLRVSVHEINKIETQTRLQSKSPLWYRVRKNRLTASNVGEIFKRRRNPEVLVSRLKCGRHVTTAAMKQGIAMEPRAAMAYNMLMSAVMMSICILVE